MNEKCTEKEWEKEMQSNKFCGKHNNWFHSGCFLACPQCKSLGFYGPKLTKNDAGEIVRKYRACKFCGFWQEVRGKVKDARGCEPYRCIHVYCDKCGTYDWQEPWLSKLRSCQKCSNETKKIEWAIDDPNHHFHSLKKIMDKIHQNLS
jgi:hypothetical protein